MYLGSLTSTTNCERCGFTIPIYPNDKYIICKNCNKKINLKINEFKGEKEMIKFKKLNENAIVPSKGREGDAGFDLFTLNEAIIKPFETIVIPTGISVQLESNQEASIRPRSGITLKGCTGCFGDMGVWNPSTNMFDFIEDKECSPYLRVQLGTLDSNYRGDIGIIVYNQENYPVRIPARTKLAQMVISYISTDEAILVEDLDNSERNEQGFGSSGVR